MLCWLRGVPKQKKPIEVLDENFMNASAKRLKHDEHLSLAGSADISRCGYFLENRKQLRVRFLNLKSAVQILILAVSNLLTLQQKPDTQCSISRLGIHVCRGLHAIPCPRGP
jgi:hypothetical protein